MTAVIKIRVRMIIASAYALRQPVANGELALTLARGWLGKQSCAVL